MKMQGLARLIGIAGAVACLAAVPAHGQSVEEFYRGKAVELYVGLSVGGGYDTHMRLVARYFGKHLPGNPTVVPLNMEGAGSLKLANWLYNVAPRDGTVLALVARGIPFEPLVGMTPRENIRFETTKFTWIGSATSEVSVCAAWERAGIDHFTDLYDKQLIVGGVGAGVDAHDFPRILASVLGAKFRMVSGYPGGADVLFAMERGEVDGRCGWSWASLLSSNQAWLDEGKIKILLQLSLAPHPDLTAMGVPWVMDLAQTDEDRQILRLMFARLAVGRPYIAPPDVPADRAEALRRAFDETMKDPEFLADARRVRLEISPLTGSEAQAIIAEVSATPSPIVERARAMLR